MTPPTSGSSRARAPRGRLLVVGAGEPMRELAKSARRKVAHVSECPDIYRAIAEVGAAGAREPVAAVAIPADAEGYEAAAVAEAFRRIDPSVQLLLVVTKSQESAVADAIAEGFEDSLSLPVDADELGTVLSELGLAEGAERASARAVPEVRSVVEIAIDDARAALRDRGHDDDAPATQPAPTTHRAPAPGPGSNHSAAHAPTPHGSPQRASSAASSAASPIASAIERATDGAHRTPQSPRDRLPPFEMPRAGSNHGAPEPTHDGPPGDIDLVRALLEGGDLHAAALRVLRHHLGTADVRFVPEPRAGEESAAAADRTGLRQMAVNGPERRFGTLVSATLDEATLGAWAEWLSHWLRLEASHHDLRRLAWSDELTGAGNRRAFEKVLADSIAVARRERRALSLMYFDIDDFKKYNDQFGHDAGDEVLRETVELLRSSIRRGDHVFRIGGDEFVVLFCDAAGPRAGGNGIPDSVEVVARRFQKAVCDMRFPQLGLDGPGTVSISAGLAAFPWDGHDAQSLLRHADLLAIESKRAGKNVITFGPGAREQIDRADA